MSRSIKSAIFWLTFCGAVACSAPDGRLDPVQPLPTERPTIRPEAYLAQAGCYRREGPPQRGDIGLFLDGETPHRFACPGASGEQIQNAVEGYRRAATEGVDLALNLTGFYIRHYTHTLYCSTITYEFYLGDELLGTETVWNNGNCRWRSGFWDEWIPYGPGDEIVTYGAAGGGPYFSPDDHLGRQPTIDTMPDFDDHSCDSWEKAVSQLGDTINRLNMKCHTSLDDTLKAIIWDSLWPHFRALDKITDTLARRECDSLGTWFAEVLAYDADTTKIGMNVIWRGTTDSVSNGIPHDAQSYGTRERPNGMPLPFHLDPKVSGSAQSTLGKRILLQTILHEIAHSWGYSDHGNNDYQNNYADVPYFRSLHSGWCT